MITEEAQTLDLPNQDFTIQGFASWFLFSVFNTLPNMWDLSSPTMDWTCAPCSGNVES